MLRKAHDVLWTAADGNWRSSLCYLQIHPESGSAQLAVAGNIHAYVISSRGYRVVAGNTTMLAVQPDCEFRNEQLEHEAGE